MIGDCAAKGSSMAARDVSLRANGQALYDVLDALRERHPALVIENCFNGGGYLDYGMLERTDVAWLTDSAGWYGARPFDLQAAFAGATRALPPSYLTVWLTEAHVHDRHALEQWGLSTMGGAWGLSLRLTELSEADHAEVGQLIRAYKRLRLYTSEGELEYVREPADDGWFALEYARIDGAALLVVRNGGSGGQSLTLSDLDARATYRISCDGSACGALGLPATASGASLMRNGIVVPLAPQQGAVLYFEKM
jgi:alpha-galactosidase